jgi:3-dehydroquinate dehydratase / shikimate dehydrogenase
MDRVLVVIGRTRHKMVVAELEEAARRGWSFIELRLDFLSKAVEFKRLTPQKKGPWVATLRRPTDGGRFAGTEDERQAILRQAIVAGCFEWVDLEVDIAEKIRRFGPVKRIVSYHNFEGTPDNLEDIYGDLISKDADVCKLAVMANTMADVQRILKLQQAAKKPSVIFGMGELGLLTRFTAIKYGAPFLYAAFNRERSIAPGLPSCDDLKTTFPVRSIDADTQFLGVVGDPVSHSLSPVLHNHMLLRTRTNAFYVPLKVPAGELKAGLTAFLTLPIQGVSVTIPHKEDAAALAVEKEPFVETAHAANTLVTRGDGRWSAHNTDYAAAVEALKFYLGTHLREDGTCPTLDQLDVLILGSGGVARALAHGLHAEKAHLTICARNEEKGHALAAEVHCKYAAWEGRHNVRCDVLINCTPMGMHPKVDESPIHHSFLQPGMVVFDTVYTPETTLLIREAKARGCGVVTGVEMFVRQAAMQFELFTKKVPDLDKMREIVRKAMSPLVKSLEQEAAAAEAGE